MSKPLSNPSGPSPARGFSLIELLLAMALSLVVLALTFTLVQELQNTADLANTSADVNENLRAAVIMMTRDLSTAGENMPGGSIALPYTPGNPSPTPSITLPTPAYPAATPFPTPYPAGASLYWPVVAAGYAAGPTQGSGANAITTDIVTIIGVDQTSSFNNTAASAPTLPASPTGSATITVSPTAAGYVTPGQLIKLTNTNGSCLLAVSTVNTTTGVITFAHGDAHDYLGVNQFSILFDERYRHRGAFERNNEPASNGDKVADDGVVLVFLAYNFDGRPHFHGDLLSGHCDAPKSPEACYQPAGHPAARAPAGGFGHQRHAD